MPFQLEYSGSQPSDGKSQQTTALDYTLEPSYELISLTAGFRPDPHSTRLTSGGGVDVTYLGNNCAGYAAVAPDVRLSWNGSSNQFRIYFQADDLNQDTTLIINRPDGGWVCNDDFDDTTRNPMIVFDSPAAGQYDIWVGSYNSGEFIVGTLSVTELNSRP
ncbi:MAG: peptidase S1 [Anaerolineae bacterium]|nr:peptidase S1 [Anaerolineae bacterium]